MTCRCLPQTKSEPQSVVGSFFSMARVSAASGVGVGSFGSQSAVGVTSTSRYALATLVSASHEALSPLPSSSAMVFASRRTDCLVSSRNCLVSVKATGTVNRKMATATSRM
ncbi:hypothetical protein M2157_004470 [Streptomyces sp. SAI-127]|nr:hypothetical protein [Streptomyces sp. SAI-127]